MFVYTGYRNPKLGCVVYSRSEEGHVRALPWRLDLWNHSPSGFEWGYPGSGPAQLALALAAHALGNDDNAVAVHQRLKRALVVKLAHDGWSITSDQVLKAIQENEGK